MTESSEKTGNAYIGLTKTAHNGMKMSIVNYKAYDDVTIRFEDGTTVYKKQYGQFLSGYVKNPNFKPACTKRQQKIKNRHIGKTNIATNGMKITIIGYERNDDITVRFEDGYIAEHTSTEQFKTGQIKNPNLCPQNRKNQRLGQIKMTSSGVPVKIIRYDKYSHIVVQFPDKSVKETDYKSFLNGNIAKPGERYAISDVQNHIGEQNIARCGQTMTIITAESSTDIDVQFQNGETVRHCKYHDFKTGNLKVPHRIINNIKYQRNCEIFSNTRYWKCRCLICGHRDYMTIDEMVHHECPKENQIPNPSKNPK